MWARLWSKTWKLRSKIEVNFHAPPACRNAVHWWCPYPSPLEAESGHLSSLCTKFVSHRSWKIQRAKGLPRGPRQCWGGDNNDISQTEEAILGGQMIFSVVLVLAYSGWSMTYHRVPFLFLEILENTLNPCLTGFWSKIAGKCHFLECNSESREALGRKVRNIIVFTYVHIMYKYDPIPLRRLCDTHKSLNFQSFW